MTPGIWPRISIVTPSFNQARFLEDTITSVLSQGYPNLEYLILDGGSTDGSVDIIRRHAGRLAYWASEPDRGQADAIAKGFGRATGEILAYLNSDDVLLPGALARVAGAFTQRPRPDLVFGHVMIVDAEGRPLGERRLCRMGWYDFLGPGNCLAQPATFWTRRVYDAAGGIDPAFYYQMDLDFYIRVVRAGGRLRHVRAPLANIRMHPDGKMAKAERIRREELALLQARYLAPGALRSPRYSRPWRLTMQFLRLACQGDLAYAGGKAWARVRDGDLFREPRS